LKALLVKHNLCKVVWLWIYSLNYLESAHALLFKFYSAYGFEGHTCPPR